MMYPKSKVLTALENRRDSQLDRAEKEKEKAIRVHESAAGKSDVDIRKSIESLEHALTLTHDGQYAQASDVAYSAYRTLGSIRTRKDEPDLSDYERITNHAERLSEIIDLLKSTESDKISTSELEKLGVLALVRYH